MCWLYIQQEKNVSNKSESINQRHKFLSGSLIFSTILDCDFFFY